MVNKGFLLGKPTFQDKAHCVCLSKIRSEYESHTAQDWTDRLLLHYNFVCWSLQTVSVCMLKTHRYTIWKKYFANTLLFVCMNDNKPPRGHVPMNDYVMTSCTNVCSILHKSVICLLDTQVGCSIKRCFFLQPIPQFCTNSDTCRRVKHQGHEK